jgi:signal transduction histidine kinase
VLIALVCTLIGTVAAWTPVVTWTSQDGVWDLSDHDFKQSVVALDGAAAYVAGEFLSPEEFEAAEAAGATRLGGLYQSDESFGTVRTRLLLPEDTPIMVAGSPAEGAERIALVSAGQVVAEDEFGTPAATKADAIPDDGYIVLSAVARGGQLDIVEQTSNWNLAQGDGITALVVGSPDLIRRWTTGVFASQLLLQGCCLALIVIHLILWVRWRRYHTGLGVAAMSLAALVNSSVTVPATGLTLVPQLTWDGAFTLQYLSMVGLGITFYLVWVGIFRWSRSRVLNWVAGVIAVVAAVLCLVLPSVEQQAVGPYVMWTAAAGFLILAVRTGWLLVHRPVGPTRPQALFFGGLIAFMVLIGIQMLFSRGGLFPFGGPDPMVSLGPLALTLVCTVAVYDDLLLAMAAARRETKAARAETEALERVTALRADMVRELSHEMHTPLAVIVGFSQLVAEEARDQGLAAQAIADLEVVAGEAKRLSTLVDQVTALPVASRQASPLGELDIADVAEHVARLYEVILSRQGTRLVLERETDLPTVRAEPDGISQVLFNLLTNAHKHTADGTVTVNLSRVGESVVVTVADTGTGVPSEFVEKVFEQYAQGPDAADGSGIGLYVSRRIVEAYGGRIWMESHPGQGTTVAFSLPISA